MRKLFYICTLFLIACNGNTRHTSQLANPGPDETIFDTLSLDEVTFNDRPLLLSLAEYKKTFRPDSTKQTDFGCPTPFDWLDSLYKYKMVTYCYAQGSRYWSNGNMALFDHVYLENNRIKLAGKRITLSGKTRLDDFSKIFPLSYSLFEQTLRAHPTYVKDEEGNYRIDVCVSKKHPDDHWIFTFKNGKLYKAELWWLLC